MSNPQDPWQSPPPGHWTYPSGYRPQAPANPANVAKVRGWSAAAVVLGALALFVPTALIAGQPGMLMNVILSFQYLSQLRPEMVLGIVVSGVAVILVITTIILGAMWLAYRPGMLGGGARVGVGVTLAALAMILSVLMFISFSHMGLGVLLLSPGYLVALLAGVALLVAGRLGSNGQVRWR